MEFGPEIKVDGVRPEWLKDSTKIVVNDDSATDSGTVYGGYASGRGWKDILTIRLPANHPHYTTPTPHERAVAPELVARLVELARSVATSPACTILQTVEAQNILAILDTSAADEIVAKQLCKENGWGEGSGAKDLALKSLARGRQLEKEGK